MKYIQRLISWWLALFTKQSVRGKFVVGCATLVMVCCICSIPLSLLPSTDPKITPTSSYLPTIPIDIQEMTLTATEPPKPTLTPEFTETSTVTYTPTIGIVPSATPSIGATGVVETIFLTSPVNAGSNATLKIRTIAGASCYLSYTTPAGTRSEAKGLGSTIADSNGICTWSWKISPNTKAGTGRLVITANDTTRYEDIVIK